MNPAQKSLRFSKALAVAFFLTAALILPALAVSPASHSTAVAPDIRGDLNLNGIPYEIGDADIYAEYFVIGLAAFTINLEAQIAQSDVNRDEITLSCADYLELLRIMKDSALPASVPPDAPAGIIAGEKGIYDNSLTLWGWFDHNKISRMKLYFSVTDRFCDFWLFPASGQMLEESRYVICNVIDVDLNDPQFTFPANSLTRFLLMGCFHDPISFYMAVAYDSTGKMYNLVPGPFDLGDVNLNGLPYELADFIMMRDFIIYGDSVLIFSPREQIMASEIDNDKVPMTLNDLTYMARVIGGEMVPGETIDSPITGQLAFLLSAGKIDIGGGFDSPAGAMQIKYYAPGIGAYSIMPGPAISSMEISYDIVHDTLDILIYSSGTGKISGPPDNIMQITFSGTPPTFDTVYAAGYKAEKVLLNLDICDNLPGDCDGRRGINIRDITYLINYLYKVGPAPLPQPVMSGDANCNCTVNIQDITLLINYLYRRGDPPCSCAAWRLGC
ncbi:MAG: dockerin type I domain-containing protein [candidate division Zixibacteria bacterium]|nr:dockerin type I domain-containing protein [candidate division Zixibacteria bacterium]